MLELQVHDAHEESKDWQQLRVSNHLRQIVNGTAVPEDTALTNSLDQISITENIQKSQLDTYQKASLRLMEQLKSTEEENQLLKRQIEEANEKISQRKKEYSSILEVSLHGLFCSSDVILKFNLVSSTQTYHTGEGQSSEPKG